MAEKYYKNPIAICLGIIIRKSREEQQWSQEAFGNMTGMTASYVKSFENGNTILHISKAYNLYRAFSNAQGGIYNYALEGFTNLLSIISILENETTNGLRDNDDKRINKLPNERMRYYHYMEMVMKSLSATNLNFKKLFSGFIQSQLFTETKSNIELSKFIEEYALHNLVESYLRFPNQYSRLGKDNEYSLDEYFHYTPTMQVPFILDTIDGISWQGRHLTYSDFSAWERQNRNRTVEVMYILTDTVNLKELQKIISFSYLNNSWFRKVTFWVSKKHNTSKLIDEISKIIELASQNDPSLLDKAKSKIQYINVEPQLIYNLHNTDDIFHSVFWVYAQTDGLNIAFYAQSDHEDIDVTNLNFMEMRNKWSKIQDLEKSLLDATITPHPNQSK